LENYLRISKERYVTENGNFVLDTIFQSIPDVRNKEIQLKNTLGVIEVGLFTKHADVYYRAEHAIRLKD
jgi:ribose 5-phosphate isomerase A